VGSVDFYECLRPFLDPKDQEKPVGLTGKKVIVNIFEFVPLLNVKGIVNDYLCCILEQRKH